MKSALIVYENDFHGRAVANAFEARAEELRISIVDRIGYEARGIRTFEQNLRELRGTKVDAVLLAGELPYAADVLAALRAAGVSGVVLGGSGLDVASFLARPEAEGTIVASIFHPDAPGAKTQELARDYLEQHGHAPDTWAAQGYDAVMLIAQAIERAGSAEPASIAAALRAPEGWEGATGKVTLDARGDVVDRRVIFKRARDQKVELVTEPAR